MKYVEFVEEFKEQLTVVEVSFFLRGTFTKEMEIFVRLSVKDYRAIISRSI